MDTTTIIWATDGSEWADGALEVVRDFVKHWPDPQIIAVHVDQRLTGRYGDVPVLADEPDIESKIRMQLRGFEEAGFTTRFELKRTQRGNPASLIAEIAEELAADVIVIGTRGHRSVAGAMLGSVTQALLHDAPCPVLAIPPKVGKLLADASTSGSRRNAVHA